MEKLNLQMMKIQNVKLEVVALFRTPTKDINLQKLCFRWIVSEKMYM